MQSAFLLFVFLLFLNFRVSAQEFGKASYYHHKFNGRKTASGEIFNNRQMTAAHRTLPFNTLVRVTNLDNGKSVVVRINDRGPWRSERIIDVSRAAAEQIDMIPKGVVDVKVEIFEEDELLAKEVLNDLAAGMMELRIVSANEEGFAILINQYTDFSIFFRELWKYQKLLGNSIVIDFPEGDSSIAYRILSGIFDTYEEAEMEQLKLQAKYRERKILKLGGE